MYKSAISYGISVFKDRDEWVLDPAKNANLFERTFASKCGLPEAEMNEFSYVNPQHFVDGFLRIRIRDLQVLNNLREGNATGPDRIAIIVLRTCAVALALPCPACQKDHRNTQMATNLDSALDRTLHKKKSVFDA